MELRNIRQIKLIFKIDCNKFSRSNFIQRKRTRTVHDIRVST